MTNNLIMEWTIIMIITVIIMKTNKVDKKYCINLYII